MSSDGVIESLETAESGFAITKELSRESGGHIQIDLEVESAHDATSIVDIVENVPPGTDQSQIGFLPNHEPQEWNLTDDGSLVLQVHLVPEGSRQVTYGLREIDPGEAEPLATEPRLVAVEGPAADEIDVEALDGVDGETPDPTGEATDADASEDEAADETEPAEADAEPTTDAPAEPAADGAGAAAAPALDSLDDDQLEALADRLEPHLDAGGGSDAVTETKLTQLQEDVGEVRTYLPALEEFLGETGRANDIAGDLEDIQDRLGKMEESPEELESHVENLDDRLERVEETVEGLDEVQGQLEALLDRLDGLEEWRAGIASASQTDASDDAGD